VAVGSEIVGLVLKKAIGWRGLSFFAARELLSRAGIDITSDALSGVPIDSPRWKLASADAPVPGGVAEPPAATP